MSVIVKGMKMPQGSCEWVDAEGHLHRCKLLNGDDDCKMQEGICADATWEEQFAGCPLVEIPTPHGDLVDRDALIAEYDRQHVGPPGGARRIIETAPTVIGPDYGDPIAGIRQKAREAVKILVNAALNAIEETEGSAK